MVIHKSNPTSLVVAELSKVICWKCPLILSEGKKMSIDRNEKITDVALFPL
jgi:hypothetical protein